MRLAHLADQHLDYYRFNKNGRLGVNQRSLDVAAAFAQSIDQVIAAEPDAVMLAGDLFDRVRPRNMTIVEAFSQFSRLRSALPRIPIVLIGGNHDTPNSSEQGCILDLFAPLGIDVVKVARRLVYPDFDLSVLAVGHAALIAKERPVLEPAGKQRHQVMVIHGDVVGVTSKGHGGREPGPAAGPLGSEDLRDDWSYIALGHYHVQQEIAPRMWYSGSLDWVSPNIWGEVEDEEILGLDRKGWLMVDLDTGEVERKPIEPARRVIDLPVIDAVGLTAAELDDRLEANRAGIDGQVVRQLVINCPLDLKHAISHKLTHAAENRALAYLLDTRKPEKVQQVVEPEPPADEVIENEDGSQSWRHEAFDDGREPVVGWSGRSDVPYPDDVNPASPDYAAEMLKAYQAMEALQLRENAA